MISRLFYPGQDVGVTSIVPLYTHLFRKGVTLTPHTELVAVEGSTVVVANAFTGAQRRIDGVDTVVLALGSRSTDAISRALRNRGAARDRRLRRTARHPPGHPRGHARGARDLRSEHRHCSPAAIFRISSGVCSSASGVPGSRYLPLARPPTSTGSKPIVRMMPSARAMAC